MFDLNASQYGPALKTMLARAPMCPLGPGKPIADVRSRLESLSFETLFGGGAITDPTMAQCCISALWLVFNYLDESHAISQEIETPSGSYWHGIMHRREPDFGNSKYWYRRVGTHPIFPELNLRARQLASLEPDLNVNFLRQQQDWDPYRFIDDCEKAYGGDTEIVGICEKVAQAEWLLLFDYCYRSATSS